MESSIAEFLKRKLACELLPTLDCVVLVLFLLGWAVIAELLLSGRNDG